MANFNLADYETVAERLVRFHADHPHARIITKNLSTDQDRQVSTWVVLTEIWLPMLEIWEDAPAQANPENSWFLKATGHAFEIDGGRGPNQTSALENAETSSIGRALANCGYSGDKKGDPNKRPSREEMEKVQRGQTPTVKRDYLAESKKVTSSAELRQLWNEARIGKATDSVLASIQALGESLAKSESEN
jgi:hypothetical protein